MAFIYALSDPRDPRIPQYVGRTKHNVIKRMFQHCVWAFENPSRPLSLWLSELRKAHLLPFVMIYEVVEEDRLKERESFWIKLFRGLGTLLNVNDGDGAGRNAVISEKNRKATAERNREGWSAYQREQWQKTQAEKHKKRAEQGWQHRLWWSRTHEASVKKWLSHPNTQKAQAAFRVCNERRKKPVVNLNTGVTFNSISEAARSIGVRFNALKAAIRNNWKCRGCNWAIVIQPTSESKGI